MGCEGLVVALFAYLRPSTGESLSVVPGTLYEYFIVMGSI